MNHVPTQGGNAARLSIELTPTPDTLEQFQRANAGADSVNLIIAINLEELQGEDLRKEAMLAAEGLPLRINIPHPSTAERIREIAIEWISAAAAERARQKQLYSMGSNWLVQDFIPQLVKIAAPIVGEWLARTGAIHKLGGALRGEDIASPEMVKDIIKQAKKEFAELHSLPTTQSLIDSILKALIEAGAAPDGVTLRGVKAPWKMRVPQHMRVDEDRRPTAIPAMAAEKPRVFATLVVDEDESMMAAAWLDIEFPAGIIGFQLYTENRFLQSCHQIAPRSRLLRQVNQKWITNAIAEIEQRADANAREDEMTSWIEAHGSPRLRQGVEKGYSMVNAYHTERCKKAMAGLRIAKHHWMLVTNRNQKKVKFQPKASPSDKAMLTAENIVNDLKLAESQVRVVFINHEAYVKNGEAIMITGLYPSAPAVFYIRESEERGSARRLAKTEFDAEFIPMKIGQDTPADNSPSEPDGDILTKAYEGLGVDLTVVDSIQKIGPIAKMLLVEHPEFERFGDEAKAFVMSDAGLSNEFIAEVLGVGLDEIDSYITDYGIAVHEAREFEDNIRQSKDLLGPVPTAFVNESIFSKLGKKNLVTFEEISAADSKQRAALRRILEVDSYRLADLTTKTLEMCEAMGYTMGPVGKAAAEVLTKLAPEY